MCWSFPGAYRYGSGKPISRVGEKTPVRPQEHRSAQVVPVEERQAGSAVLVALNDNRPLQNPSRQRGHFSSGISQCLRDFMRLSQTFPALLPRETHTPPWQLTTGLQEKGKAHPVRSCSLSPFILYKQPAGAPLTGFPTGETELGNPELEQPWPVLGCGRGSSGRE